MLLLCVQHNHAQNLTNAFGTYPVKNLTGQILPNGLVENLLIDSKNRMWIGTRMGLCCYTGNDIKVFNKADGLIDHSPYSLAEDKEGRIFVGYSGGINIIEGESIRKIDFPDTLNVKGLIKIISNLEGEMVFFFSEWIGVWDNESLKRTSNWGNKGLIHKVFYDKKEDEFWVSTFRNGVYLISDKDTIKTKFNCNEATGIVKDHNEKVWMSVWDKKIFRFDGEKVDTFYTDAIVTDFVTTDDNVLWAASFDRGLMKIDEVNQTPSNTNITFFDASNGFSGSSLWTLTKDLDGNIWTGNFGSGISVFRGEHLINFNKNQGFPGNNINMTLADTSNNIWSATDDGVLKLNSDGVILEKYDRERYPNLPNNKFKCIVIDKDQTVYTHIYGDVFTKIKGDNVDFHEIPAGFYMVIANDTLSIGSDYRGIERYDKNTFEKIDFIEVDTLRPRNRVTFLTFDEELKAYFFVNNIGELFGYSVSNKKLFNYTAQLASTKINRVRWIKKDHKGNYWLGGEGIANISIDDTSLYVNDYFTEMNGLPALFAIYGCIDNKNKELVIATNNGASILDIEDYYRNKEVKFINLGRNEGMNVTNLIHASKDQNQDYWFSSESGLYKFIPDKMIEKNTLPKIYISGLNLFLNKVDWAEQLSSNDYDRIDIISKMPINPSFDYNQNHLTFRFQGVHLTEYDDLIYSSFLEGFDNDWSKAYKTNYITYSNLPPGKYKFYVKASVSNDTWTDPVIYEFTILPPFWKTVWFIVLVAVFSICLILYVIHMRTRKLKLFAKKLETKVEERTAELSSAYTKIEQKNSEILDSITYAKRLQDAILPSTKVVKSFLMDSFILYKPKDIVAGDFYFMDVVEEGNRKLIYYVAADCTGHGVPGAMVSIVGANGLKRCIQEFGLREPGKILDKLSEIVAENFSQSEEKIRDGMDLAICCLESDNYQIENDQIKRVHYAGANNPLWVINKNRKMIPENAKPFKEGGGFEIKANKQAIGYTENIVPFDTHTIELEPGDTLYTFSDGYPDQFGGDNLSAGRHGGKKLKSANFRKMLFEIQDKTMDEQLVILDKRFEGWRGDLEQVDDVCVIGVRIQ